MWLGLINALEELAWKVAPILFITPFMGYLYLILIESLEKAIKSQSRRKKWSAYCSLFFLTAFLIQWIVYAK